MFERYLQSWNLKVDGVPVVTPGSHLLPVRWQGQPAMLKIAHTSEEQLGGQLMSWWSGEVPPRCMPMTTWRC